MSDLKFKKYQNILLKNSEVVDNFINENLPKSQGLSKKLIEAMRYSILGSGKKIRSSLIIELGKTILETNNITLNDKYINTNDATK